MGSVKKTVELIPAYENCQGEGLFIFSDDYSIRDWGKMPDQIHNKGRALVLMSASNFIGLEEEGIWTHYHELVDAKGQSKLFPSLKKGDEIPNAMKIDLAKVYKPVARSFLNANGQPNVTYDYSFFDVNRGEMNNYVVPLEIIFRNGLLQGSSIFNKIKKAGQIKDIGERESVLAKIYQSLGLTEEPQPGTMLPKPIISYTTKFEEGDRNLTVDEAAQISGLRDEDFSGVEDLALSVNEFITERAQRAGLGPHWDGKIELVYFDGCLFVADVLGTLDENRFGNLVSKEVLRRWYDQNQPEFAQACAEWKQTGAGWQERCPVKPENLPSELCNLVSQMYQAAANQYIGKELFDVPELEKVMEKINDC